MKTDRAREKEREMQSPVWVEGRIEGDYHKT